MNAVRLTILFLFILPAIVFGQQNFSEVQRKKLDSIATQDVPAGAPGIATAVIQNGKLVYEKYAGYADLADSSHITVKTRFNIASNGKQFTALAVLILVDEKKLDLSDDIRKFFPALYPGIKEKITVQSLLNHTSGIRDCYDLWSLQGYTWWEQSFSNADVLQLIALQTTLNFSPNTQYLYSNTNYILLALIIEKITGQSFVEYTKAMFKKLNMPNTSFENKAANIRGPVARAYFNFGSWTTYQWKWNVCGDGNIFSTLEDQEQWEKIIQGTGKTTIKRNVISKSQQPISGSAFSNYGYGLEFGKYKEVPYSFHEGATGAWKATTIRFPAKKITIITLTNTGKSIPSMQTRQMADVILGFKNDAAYLVTRPATIGNFISDDTITGTYLTASDFAFIFEKRDKKMFLKRDGRNDVELEREAANIFHQKYDTAFKQEFTTNDRGQLQVTAYYINHAPYSLVKTSITASATDLEKWDGTYSNKETGTAITIEHTTGTGYEIIFPGDDKSKGLLVADDKILAGGYSLLWKNGDIYLDGERIKKVEFVKQ